MTGLSGPVRRAVASDAVSAFGTGLVLPLTLIYLHRVRHIPLPTVGLLLAIPGAIGLIAVPLSGTVMDRIGARRVLAASMALLAVAQVALGFVTTAAWAAPVLLVQGAAMGPTFPAFTTLLAGLTTGSAQQRAFAINFTLINAGIGVGGIVSGTVVDVSHAMTFQALFWGNAAITVLAAAIVWTVPEPVVDRTAAGTGASGGYRQVLADRFVRRALVLMLLLAVSGYAALDSTLPAYGNVVAAVSARVVALSLSANTLTIVLLQLPVLRLLRGRRRTLAIAAVGVIWCASWVLFACCALPGSQTMRDAVVIAFAALFGFGETFMAPSMAPLLNGLAPDGLRGRVNALGSGMYSIAFVISPAISAAFVASGLGGVWVGLLAGAALLVTVFALRLSRRLDRAMDVATETAAPEPEPEFVTG